MSNICFLLSCLMVPLSFGLIDLQSTLSLTGTEHTVVELLILLVIFWLIWLINQADRWLYLHNFSSEKKNLRSHERMVEPSIFMIETSITPDSTANIKKTGEVEKRLPEPSAALVVHETRATFDTALNKNGQ